MPEEHFSPQNAFEGYVKASLENLKERLDKLPCDETFKRLNKCENNIENIKGRATVLGAIFGLIAGIVSKIFFWK